MKHKFLSVLISVAMFVSNIYVTAAVNDDLVRAKNELTFSQLSTEQIFSVTQDFTLPVNWNYSTQIIWESSDENLLMINGDKAVVKRPPFGEGKSTVILTALIMLGDEYVTKRFALKISAQDISYTYSQELMRACNKFDADFMSLQDITAITNDLKIPFNIAENITVSVFSDKPELVDNSGKVVFPYTFDEECTLYVNVSYGYEKIRLSYPLTIKAKGENDARAIARLDAEKAIDSLKNAYDLSKVISSLVLPKTGENGSKLMWVSSRNDVLSAEGAVTRQSADVTVNLDVVATFANVTESKSVSVVVKKKSDDPISSASGGGSVNESPKFDADLTIPEPEEVQPAITPSKNTFSDVDSTHWAYSYIEKLAENNIVSGFDGKFLPNNFITRNEFVTMIVKALNLKKTSENKVVFDDLDPDDWSYNYIDIAYENNIIRGISDKLFGSGENILRQDACVIIYNALDIEPDENAEQKFSDADLVDEYAKSAVAALSQVGIINGREGNKFAPKEFITRAETAKIIFDTISYSR